MARKIGAPPSGFTIGNSAAKTSSTPSTIWRRSAVTLTCPTLAFLTVWRELPSNVAAPYRAPTWTRRTDGILLWNCRYATPSGHLQYGGLIPTYCDPCG